MTHAPAPRLLLIEDEPDLLDAMVTFLNMDGFTADGVSSLTAATSWIKTHAFDILILDLGLPDGDGLEWLSVRPELRHKGIVITTARGTDKQRIEGIQCGADIYLVKPISLEELASLLYNLWRRLKGNAEPAWTLQPLAWNLLSPMGRTVKLTHSELNILQRLASQPGLAIARQELVTALGQDPDSYDYRRMEILVRRLRNKVRDSIGMDLPLETVHRLGYAFTSPLRVAQ